MTHEEIFATLATELVLLPGAAAVLVPVPDQVPGRAAAQERADPGARVHHEGLLQLRHRRGRAGRVVRRAPRRLRADLRPARASRRSPSRPRAAPWAAPTRSSSCARRRPARTWSPAARTAITRPTWRRRPRRCRRSTIGRRARPEAPAEAGHAGRTDDRRPGHRLRPGRRPADQDAGQVVDGQLTLVLLRGDHPLPTRS